MSQQQSHLPRGPHEPSSSPDLTTGLCPGGATCDACRRAVPHTLHRCTIAACACHQVWQIRAAELDALYRCGLLPQ